MLMRRDPLTDLFAWRWAMDRLPMLGLIRRPIGGPDIELTRTREGLVVRVAMPDVRPEDVDIRVQGDRLTVRAQVRQERVLDRYGRSVRERRMGLWEHTLRLPFRVDSGRAEAELAGGVLTVRLPRAEGVVSRLKHRLRRALHALRPPRRRTVRVRVV